MNLQLHNTLSGRKEPFTPLRAESIGLYHCGPTVTEPVNVHKFRSYLLGDVLRRYLEFLGLGVRQVMNITDVGHLNEFEDDVIEISAGRSGKQPWELIEEEVAAFHADRRALRILDAHHYPQSREHVGDMIERVERFLAAGLAYRTEHNVYLDIRRFPSFGRLSGKPFEELTRLAQGFALPSQADKRHPLDIDLWRTDILHQTHWRSPWGLGFPGWHLECVVMSQKYLGESFDIHTGSEEIVFPHHDCEIAQAEILGGKPLARIWLHSAHVLLEGKPISRRHKTLLTARGLLGEGFSGVAIRLALLSEHYRRRIDFGPGTLDWAQSTLKRLQKAAAALKAMTTGRDRNGHERSREAVSRRLRQAQTEFEAAMDDDLDYPRALKAALALAEDFAAAKAPPATEATELLQRFDSVLGLL